MGQQTEASEKLDALVRRTSDLHARVSSLYEQLAADPTPRSAEEHALRTLLDERETLAADIGNVVIGIVADGGNVTVDGEAPAPRARATTSDPVVIRRTPTERRTVQPEAAALVFKRDPNAERQRLALVELIEMLGEPVLVDNARKFESEVKKLHTSVGRMDAWVGQPAPAQQALLGLSSSKARHIQDECGVPFPFFLRAPLHRVRNRQAQFRLGLVQPPGQIQQQHDPLLEREATRLGPRSVSPSRAPQRHLARRRSVLVGPPPRDGRLGRVPRQ